MKLIDPSGVKVKRLGHGSPVLGGRGAGEPGEPGSLGRLGFMVWRTEKPVPPVRWSKTETEMEWSIVPDGHGQPVP